MDTYEKKYNKALKWMRELYPGLHGATKEDAEHYFPELRKSDDERVIEEIKFAIMQMSSGREDTKQRCLAWVEKQKEHSMSAEEVLTRAGLKPYKDGNQWCILAGDNIQEGICGFGDTIEDALYEFLKEVLDFPKEQKPKMTPKWLYRLEFRDSSCGLWYDGYGKWCFESGIGSISGCKTKTLPMDYDARYKQDGRDWFSSCSRKEDLMHWYSLEDAKELLSKGFVFTRYLATEYHEYEQQTVFIKETALYREEIDIFELFGQKPAEWDDYTKTNLDRALQIIKKAKGNLQGYQSDDGIYECDKAIECLEHFLYRGLEIEKPAE